MQALSFNIRAGERAGASALLGRCWEVRVEIISSHTRHSRSSTSQHPSATNNKQNNSSAIQHWLSSIIIAIIHPYVCTVGWVSETAYNLKQHHFSNLQTFPWTALDDQ